METKEQLFPDSELIQNKRPIKITEKQEWDFYEAIAKEIIKGNWSNSDLEDIIADVSQINKNDSGYEIAKELEGYRKEATYDIDTQFIEFLDDFGYRKDKILEANVKLWVKAHDPQPKFLVGTELIINKQLYRGEYEAGKIIYITGYAKNRALYMFHSDKNHNGGVILPYELIESHCSLKTKE